VDGIRVEGVAERVFVRNFDTYYLADLIIYADGLLDTGSGPLTDLAGLREELLSGRVTIAPEPGAEGSGPYANWRFTDVTTWVGPDMFVAEVADRIDRLNDRPISADRCRAALESYLADATEPNRLAVRERYLAVPEHRRRATLGRRVDAALQVLTADLGSTLLSPGEGRPDHLVTPESHAWAITVIREEGRRHATVLDGNASHAARRLADGPAEAPAFTLVGWRKPEKQLGLHNNDPVPVTVDGVDHPTVTHAYWALATGDPQRILAEPDPHAVIRLGQQLPIGDGWPARRLAVMTELLRAKFQQHPELVAVLAETGESPILYQDVFTSDFWTAGGANWTGRLLQLIRSELAGNGPEAPRTGA
jgi:predicted NAD-dependent protein-ADP-ribosyltransferase YbiA (DUF1768 family)